jgi:signal peptidase I
VGRVADGTAGLTDDRAAAPTRRRPVRRALPLLGLLVLLAVAGSVAGLLPVQLMRVDSGSMTPTIAPGDLLVVERGASPVGRRDVVVVPQPGTGALLVKRVVAVGGDRVGMADGVLVVDGEPVCERSIDPARQAGVWFGPVAVPDGELFLMGDDRGDSVDSRTFGSVPADDVLGLVRLRAWPHPGRLPPDTC